MLMLNLLMKVALLFYAYAYFTNEGCTVEQWHL